MAKSAFRSTFYLITSPHQSASSSVISVNRNGISVKPDDLRASVQPLREVSSIDLVRWESLRQGRPEYQSPFFSVAFAQAVDKSRGDVSLAMIRRGDSLIAFLPFHRIGTRTYPVGRFFNDAHNLITASGESVCWHWLLEKINAKTYEFHALSGTSGNELPSHTGHATIRSFHCDIGDDSHAYLRGLGRAHKTIGRQGQKSRKMTREIGALDFEFDCRSVEAFEQNFCWKRDQYARTHILDLFRPAWTISMMRELFESRGKDPRQARGLLSVLRAGGQTVASHFGFLEGDLLHYWFPAYDPGFAQYSPGTALFCSILGSASAHGIRCLDMGYGELPYKLRQTDATDSVVQGCMARSGVYRQLRFIETQAINAAKRVPVKEPVKRIWRTLWPSAGISKLN